MDIFRSATCDVLSLTVNVIADKNGRSRFFSFYLLFVLLVKKKASEREMSICKLNVGFCFSVFL